MQIVNNLTLDVTNVWCIIFIKIYASKSLVCKLIYTNIVNCKDKNKRFNYYNTTFVRNTKDSP